MSRTRKHSESLPVQSRPRTRSSVTIRHLPPEILTQIFSGLHIRDLLSVRKVSRRMHEVTDDPTLWRHASFFKSWPKTERNYKIFRKAAEHNNFEALVKLAFSKLYNERLPDVEKTLTLEDQARQAADLFMRAEQLSKATFIWIFLRPPWSVQASCCKSKVFDTLMVRAHEQETRQERVQASDGRLALCLGRTFELKEMPEEAEFYVQKAAEQGLPEAQLLNWILHYTQQFISGFQDYGKELKAVRQLRSMMTPQSPDVWTLLALCRCYAKGMLGGMEWSKAIRFTRQIFQSSVPLDVEPVLAKVQPLNSSMRYILVDWLVEVGTNLNMTTQMLLNAMTTVDRCMLARPFRRRQIQLLGVASILITSRAMAEEILTIREAAWYTDNTYTYENVVEMIGDIVSILKGSIRQVTSYNFFRVLEPASGLEAYGLFLCEYMAEVCMLHSHMTSYTPALMAASYILLARLWLNLWEAWPSKLEEVTGFTTEDLTPCVLNMNKCLLDGVRYDSQHTPMQAVKQRFGQRGQYDLTNVKPLSDQELQDKLGAVSPKETMEDKSRLKLNEAEELICSPPRGKHKWRMSNVERPSRDDVATPPVDLDNSGYDGDNDEDSDPFELNESFCSSRSEDTESEPRPDNSFSEMSSEPDSSETSSEPDGASSADRSEVNVEIEPRLIPDHSILEMSSEGESLVSSNSPPSFISGCSEAALSSPYRIRINISTFSSSSGFGSNYSLSTLPFPSLGSSSEMTNTEHTTHETSISCDTHSLGFSCREISSQDDDDNSGLGQGVKMNEPGSSQSEQLPFPIMVSSAFSEKGGQDQGKFHDLLSLEDGEEDYGVLNEAFCEQELDQAPAASSLLPLPSQDEGWKNTSPSTSMNRKLISQGGQAVMGSSDRDIAMLQGKGQLVANCTSSRTTTQPPSQGIKRQDQSHDSVFLSHYSVETQGNSSMSGQVMGIEMEGTPNGFVPLDKGDGSAVSEGIVGNVVGSPAHGGRSFGVPVQVSSPSPEHDFKSVPEGDSVALRRKSLRSGRKPSPQFQENGALQGQVKDKSGEFPSVVCVLPSIVCVLKKNRACGDSLSARDSADQKGGVVGEESLASATKRKSPRSPAQIMSFEHGHPKRQRQCSASSQNI